MILRLGILMLTGLAFTSVFILSCNNIAKNHSHENVSDGSIENGKVLAAKYCQSCHLLPDPSLLDSKRWEEGVLPNMAPRLGIFSYKFKYYPSSKSDFNLRKGFYPAKPLMSLEEWQNIIDYYTSTSPDTLPGQQRNFPVAVSGTQFKVEAPASNKQMPTTCFLQIDSLSSHRQIIVSDVNTRNIYRYSSNLTVLDSFKNISPVVDIERYAHNFLVCNIGDINPNNAKYGSAHLVSEDATGKMKPDSSIRLTDLARPVQISSADFNTDGKTDLLVCEYGNLTGALSWMENITTGKYLRHVIREVPGAIKAYITDVNKDGLPDIWALFAQGDEGIILFMNEGNGKFKEQRILSFPAVFGSSYFELDDFNQDGFQDILYTCGDNADYSAILKPFHGIYIFINDGTNHFGQKYFYPMHGCFKAMARDFNGDGKLDIAAMSFFADYANHPDESFLYLEGKGNLDFKPYTIPGTSSGRWLTMDAGDIDGDGKPDIVLGNFSIAPSFIKSSTNWRNGPPFIVLKNISKK